MYSRLLIIAMLLLSFTSLASAKNILIFPAGNDEVVINTTKVAISSKGQEDILTELLVQALSDQGVEVVSDVSIPVTNIQQAINNGNYHDILEFNTTNTLAYTTDLSELSQDIRLKPSLVNDLASRYNCDYFLYGELKTVEVGIDHNDGSLEALLAMRWGGSYDKEMPIVRAKVKVSLIDAKTGKCVFSKYYSDKDEITLATMERKNDKLTAGSKTINDDMLLIAMSKIANAVSRDLQKNI